MELEAVRDVFGGYLVVAFRIRVRVACEKRGGGRRHEVAGCGGIERRQFVVVR